LRDAFDDRRVFPAVMIVGALVLVEVTVRITEASMTLRRSGECRLN
jgi:hypothetical protein